jgi:hypothetical protein
MVCSAKPSAHSNAPQAKANTMVAALPPENRPLSPVIGMENRCGLPSQVPSSKVNPKPVMLNRPTRWVS